ncbi:MAG TPA: phosphoribosylamine--glycine ligase [Acidimicrobiia bacterium]|nr:phosphoribosylamine--glycine ligase [Acidimicrobiia bacterium]
MNVLVVGSGGREHALVWALQRSASVAGVHAAPGNAGIAHTATCHALDPNDPRAVAALARELAVDLVVPAADRQLVNGVADAVRAEGIPAFGPGADGARLEGSKAWMKDVARDAGIPTARHASFGPGEEDAALAFLESMPGLYVVKTDGLAEGKGVFVTEDLAAARDTVRSYLAGDAFGDAGRTLVIEEGMTGPELSLLAVCNGDPYGARPLTPAQDFKRIGDGDTGLNTGGMGAYSPVPIAEGRVDELMGTFVTPTLEHLAGLGIDYRGVLYAGLMFTPDGPKLVEYNVRFGDPEAQVVLPRLETDAGELLMAAARGDDLPELEFSDRACVTVVMATEGYPVSPYRTGDVIEGLAAVEATSDAQVFHAGTAAGTRGELVTAGGRVLAVTAFGSTIDGARRGAYGAVELVTWPGVQYRRDIAADPT